MIEVIILAGVSLFVLSRLYAALGSDDGPPEGRSRQPAQQSQPGGAATEVRQGQASPVFTGPAAGGLEEIHAADPSFNTRDFLQGAKSAYELIVSAYARGDRDALRPLLDDDVFEAWTQAIEEREATGEAAFDLLRITKVEIDDAALDGGMAQVMVRYEAELGDGERTRTAREIWTYKRDVSNTDPNWILDDVEAAS